MNKKIKFLLSALVTGLFIVSAGGSEDTPSKPMYKDDIAIQVTFKELIKKHLRDPDSYEYISTTPAGDLDYGDGKMFTIKYRAKNGFGGYNVNEALVSCDSTTMTLISTGDY